MLEAIWSLAAKTEMAMGARQDADPCKEYQNSACGFLDKRSKLGSIPFEILDDMELVNVSCG